MFVRVKRISGKEYAYAVENTWVKGRSKQKVKKYLGPLYRYEKISDKIFEEWKDEELEHYIDTTSTRVIMKDLVRYMLDMHGFMGRPPKNNNVIVDLKRCKVTKDGRDVAVAVGEGYLCGPTIRALVNIKPVDEERRGAHLAKCFLNAGIPIDRSLFVLIYRKIHNV